MNHLISPKYKKQCEQLHATSNWGADGHRWYEQVIEVMKASNSTSILDYGCGKGTLRTQILMDERINLDPQRFYEYDPAIPAKSKLPPKADLVVCTDVLEHIEPNKLEEVLDHLDNLMIKAMYLRIDMREANTILPDGRNAHLIVADANFWRTKLARFPVRKFNNISAKKLEVVICQNPLQL